MTEIERPLQGPAAEALVEMGRLNGLSDGVFAFALTLLVLDVRVPEEVLAGDVGRNLLALAPKLLVYLISFVVIGGAWGSHQRMLSQIKRGDGLLVWFNLLSLLFVSLTPASAALLGRFPTLFVALACFAADVILIQLTALWLWRHASRHGLVNASLDPRVVDSIGRRLSISAVLFGLSIPLALVSTPACYVMWVGTFCLLFTTDWLSWQQALKTRQAAIPLDGAARARLQLEHGAGQLNIGAEGAGPNLLQGHFGGGLESRTQRAGEVLDVHLQVPTRQGFMSLRFPWTWGPSNLLDWQIGLNRQVPLALSVESIGGAATLELGALQVTELDLKASAGTAVIGLPERAGQTTARIEAASASLVIRVPPGVAARIETAKAMASAEIDIARFPVVQDGHEYRSADYDTAVNRVDLAIDVAVGSVKVE